jgi:hypothetical protein
MKGIIRRAAAAACVGSGLTLAWGCGTYHDLVDPCWPARYDAMAMASVESTFAAQINNGHILDQTVWNYHFVPGTAQLTTMGQSHLAYLARRRPAPDPKVFLQTAQDVAYDATKPDEFAAKRAKLDADRTQAVLAYLQADTAGRPVAFDITVHDPAEPGFKAQRMYRTQELGQGAILEMDKSYRGNLPLSGGASGSSATGGK